MSLLVTGAAGFIGFHTIKSLLEEGESVIGIDSLNEYYDVTLKLARLEVLKHFPNFTFHKINIASPLDDLAETHPDIRGIIHLAAQAGVRYSLENPRAYCEANLVGHLNVLELARRLKKLDNMVYASSSSVYGKNTKLPFSVEDKTDQPISLYAATKKADELMSHAYGSLYQIPLTGLRYFTVYGPWGRPDMAAFIFTKAILAGEKLPLFNQGKMRRNFTYIDDIVNGTIRCLRKPGSSPKVYNIGNNKSEDLMDFIATLERHLGKPALLNPLPMQLGDVKETIADIKDTQEEFGFNPSTNIDVGLKNFTDWYKEYYHVKAA